VCVPQGYLNRFVPYQFLNRAHVHSRRYEATGESMSQIVPTEVDDASLGERQFKPASSAHCFLALIQVRNHLPFPPEKRQNVRDAATAVSLRKTRRFSPWLLRGSVRTAQSKSTQDHSQSYCSPAACQCESQCLVLVGVRGELRKSHLGVPTLPGRAGICHEHCSFFAFDFSRRIDADRSILVPCRKTIETSALSNVRIGPPSRLLLASRGCSTPPVIKSKKYRRTEVDYRISGSAF
jgi:hypothetical protein